MSRGAEASQPGGRREAGGIVVVCGWEDEILKFEIYLNERRDRLTVQLVFADDWNFLTTFNALGLLPRFQIHAPPSNLLRN